MGLPLGWKELYDREPYNNLVITDIIYENVEQDVDRIIQVDLDFTLPVGYTLPSDKSIDKEFLFAYSPKGNVYKFVKSDNPLEPKTFYPHPNIPNQVTFDTQGQWTFVIGIEAVDEHGCNLPVVKVGVKTDVEVQPLLVTTGTTYTTSTGEITIDGAINVIKGTEGIGNLLVSTTDITAPSGVLGAFVQNGNSLTFTYDDATSLFYISIKLTFELTKGQFLQQRLFIRRTTAPSAIEVIGFNMIARYEDTKLIIDPLNISLDDFSQGGTPLYNLDTLSYTETTTPPTILPVLSFPLEITYAPASTNKAAFYAEDSANLAVFSIPQLFTEVVFNPF